MNQTYQLPDRQDKINLSENIDHQNQDCFVGIPSIVVVWREMESLYHRSIVRVGTTETSLVSVTFKRLRKVEIMIFL
jgi:hypothetical protein